MTKTMMAGLAAGLAAFSLYAAQPAATALVSVDLSKEEGPVKLMNRRGTDPAERAFYKAFCDFNPLKHLKSAAIGMDRDEHLFSRHEIWGADEG